MNTRSFLGLCLGAAVAACTTDAPGDIQDGADDSFTAGGKADGYDLTYAEIAGVLKLVNTADQDLLHSKVGLSTAVTTNILAHRDGVDGTPDNFDDLKELDGVKQVGSHVFDALLEYAKTNGYVDDSIRWAGGPYTDFDWPTTTDGYFNFDVTLSINVPPPAGNGYFWSHEFYFQHGDTHEPGQETGYIGLQATPDGPRALFSIWNATGATAGDSGTECQTFGGEGIGYSCRATFNWVVDHEYRLRVWKLADDLWGGWILDMASGHETFLGQINTAPGIGNLQHSVVWTENFLGNRSAYCSDFGYAKATFSKVGADDSTVIPERGIATYGDAPCNTSNATTDVPTGSVQEVGTPGQVQRVSLGAHDGRYLSAISGGGGSILTSAATVGRRESFALVDLGQGNVAIQSDDGHYLTADDHGTVRASARRLVGPGTFVLTQVGSSVTLLAANGKYLSSASGGLLAASATTAGAAETFDIGAAAP